MTDFVDRHDPQIQDLAQKFASFAYVDKPRISYWLNQFREVDQPLALNILHSITYYGPDKIVSACLNMSKIAKHLFGDDLTNTFFFGLGAAGKSGGEILHRFRQVNLLHTPKYDHKFLYTTEVSTLDKQFTGNLVFLDDFVGSGLQSSTFLNSIVATAPKDAKVILLTIAGFMDAIENVSSSTGCAVNAIYLLPEEEKVFSPNNPRFTDLEKRTIKAYCGRTGSRSPIGYSDTGALVAFAHGAPNNTISILTHDSDTWRSLFKRLY